MKMKENTLFGLLLLISTISFSSAFIVPDEVPSLLSLIYSNIPPIRKGTDSRVGFGFRLGEHADFQVQLELGPQKETRKIGTTESSSNKRAVNPVDYKKTPNNKPKSWLENWSKQTKQKQIVTKDKADAAESLTGPRISESALRQLQQLYGKPNENTDNSVGTFPGVEQKLPGGELKFRRLPELNAQFNSAVNKRDKDKITADLSNVEFDK